jgi:peptide/nickel transport system permease protein
MKKKTKGTLFTTPMIIASAILLLIVFCALFGKLIAPYDPDKINLSSTYQSPTAAHWFGTDNIGRDQFSRMLCGAQSTILNALMVVLISVAVGVPVGLLCGFYSGIADNVVMRVWDILMSLPPLILAFVFVAVFGRGEYNAVLATGIVFIPMISKLARSLILTEKSQLYVEAARSMGYSDMRIIFIHILPNCVSTLLSELTLDLGYAILSLATLSYLGFGVSPPASDWGSILQSGMSMLFRAPMVALAPGAAIVLTVVSLNVVSDCIQMYLDPNQRKLPSFRRFRGRDSGSDSTGAGLIDIENLRISVMTIYDAVNAVRGVDLTVLKGETHGIVGESGCGKSMFVKSMLRLHDESKTDYRGRVLMGNTDILKMKKRQIVRLRGESIAMVFQNPMTALDPIMKCGEQIGEMLRKKKKLSRAEARRISIEMFEKLGILPAEKRYDQYPFELSGGMLQRVVIAMALACNPKLLIADEPTTALDVTIQAQILELLKDIQKKFDVTIILITHDLGVIAEVCDRVSVMYAGKIVESSDVAELFDRPAHPYTRALLECNPKSGDIASRLSSIPGAPPSLTTRFEGCAFAPRCRFAADRCKQTEPDTSRLAAGHTAACHYAAELYSTGGISNGK